MTNVRSTTLSTSTLIRRPLLLSGFLVVMKLFVDHQLLNSCVSKEMEEAQTPDWHVPKNTKARKNDALPQISIRLEETGKRGKRIDEARIKDEETPLSPKQSKENDPAPDGYFNSVPVYFRNKTIHSTTSCVGNNFLSDAWKFRSCEFRNFCMDLYIKKFVIFHTPDQMAFERQSHKRHPKYYHVSSTLRNQSVSLGGINPKWREPEVYKLNWFPKIRRGPLKGGYYELPGHVWIPYHALAAHNPGHMIWDDFFPIYKLLSMFGRTEDPLFLTRMPIKLWGDCDWKTEKQEQCGLMIPKFISLMGIKNESLTTPDHSLLNTIGDSDPQSKYVCAPTGLAGLGFLTDHGNKRHGWDEEDYRTTYNAGRGAILFAFRKYMLSNLGIPVPQAPSGPPYKIIFSILSSNSRARRKGFGKQIEMVEGSFSRSELVSEVYRMSHLTVEEQARVVSDAAIFVTVTGGGASTATFLPAGATLIIMYEATGGIKMNQKTGAPAHLDWDLLNHASHLRVHWMPLERMDEINDLDYLRVLIQNELDIIRTNAAL